MYVCMHVYDSDMYMVSAGIGGEGSLMGGLIVMGSTDQGVLFEYRERVFGDHANHDDVMAAVRRIKPNIHIVS